jgi:glucose-1-phosphate cytidylyltransferase
LIRAAKILGGKIKAIILAGGLGTRISEYTEHTPKPMVTVGDRPLIWHIMNGYAAQGVTDFVILSGYKGYVIKEYFANYRDHSSNFTVDLSSGAINYLSGHSENWRVTVLDTGENTMTGGRLKQAHSLLQKDETFFMTYGDGLSDVDISQLLKSHSESGKLATVTAVRPEGRFGVLELGQDGSSVIDFREKPQDEVGLINGGFFVLHESALNYIDSNQTYWEREPMRDLAKGGQLNAYKHLGFWKPCDTLRDKRELDALWESNQAPWLKAGFPHI